MVWMLKAACLVVYALALAGQLAWLSAGLSRTMGNIAIGLLLVHALELVVVFGHVRRYRGPLAVSVGLTLLFGLLHWKPLADAVAQDRR